MRKVKRNLVLFFSILTLVAVMFTACPHVETRNYKTLTLHIQGKEDQKLYYQNGWYSDVKGNDVDSEKPVNVDEYAFDVKKPTWTVTFDVKVPDGVADDKKAEFKVETGESPVTVTAGDLTFIDVKTIVDAANGKLLENASIDNDTTVNGTYAAGKISDDTGIQIKAADGYKFKEWEVEGKTTTDLKAYEIKGNIKFTATFEVKTPEPEPPVEQVKKLTIGEKNYYYKGSAWYSAEACEESQKITEIPAADLPTDKSTTLTATLSAGEGMEFADGYTTSLTATSTFLGYGLESGEVVIKYGNEKCTLPSGGIEKETEYSEKWSTPHYTKPADPKDKNNAMDFDKWVDTDKNEYKFAEVGAEDKITLTASWISKNVLKVNVSDSSSVSYWYKDGKWYGAADYTDEKVTGFTVEKPAEKKGNVTVNFDSGTAVSGQDADEYFKDKTTVSIPFKGYVIKDDAPDKTVIIDSGLTLPSTDIFSKSSSVEVVANFDDAKTLKLPKLERKDFTFGGYKNGSEVTKKDGEAVKINETSETVWTAQWTAVPVYTLTLDGTVKAWYKAGKWYSNSECSTELSENKITDLPGAKSYDITLELDGGTLAGVTSPAKTTDGEFLGYFEKDSDGKPTGTAVIDKDGSVAELKLSGNRDLVSKFNDAKFTKPADPTADNRTFSKWVKVTGDVAETEDAFKDGAITVTENITLKAIYDWNVATVTIGGTPYYYKENAWYKEQECQTKVTEVEGYQKTKEITATLNSGEQTFSTSLDPLTTNITFKGYKQTDDETVILTDSGAFGSLSGYDYNGKTFTETWEGAQFSAPNPAPTCQNESKVFKEWQKGGVKYEFNVKETKNIQLTAIWETKPEESGN